MPATATAAFVERRVEGPVNDGQRKLYAELGELTRYIETTMRQLRQVEAPINDTTAQLPQASEHLSDLSKLTEEGTHRVMELTEAIQENRQALARDLTKAAQFLANGGSIPDALHQLKGLEHRVAEDDRRLVEIMTALSFQDLVAQRIKKIITILDDVEHKLLEMVVVFGLKQEGTGNTINGKADQMLKELEASKATALKQDLVDDILGQFGFN